MEQNEPRWILLVEDHLDLQDVIVVLLEQDGYAVARANNGRDALALLRGPLRPAVILLDFHMPSMDARTFRLEQLETDLQLDVPVILYSNDRTIDASELQVQHLLRKPFEYEDLRAAIASVCATPVALAAAS